MYGTAEQYLEAKSFLEGQETVSEQELESGRLMRRALSKERFCEDTNDGATDRYGDGCTAYDKYPHWCLRADSWSDGDFHASEMCCTCGGGSRISISDNYPVGVHKFPWDKFVQDMEALFQGSRDWCDCGKKGFLRIKANGVEHRLYSGEGAVINWGKPVREVQWKCSEQGGWQRAAQSPAVQNWKLGFKHQGKVCCKSLFDCGFGKSTGRIWWYWG